MVTPTLLCNVGTIIGTYAPFQKSIYRFRAFRMILLARWEPRNQISVECSSPDIDWSPAGLFYFEKEYSI